MALLDASISLVARWFARPERLDELRPALVELAERVARAEPGTLAYLVHAPVLDDPRLIALPPVAATEIVFFETYADADAFRAHVEGPAFTAFVAAHGDCFVAAGGKPYTSVTFLRRLAGFAAPVARAPDAAAPDATAPDATHGAPVNAHPAVMFELIARDQPLLLDFYQRVFGWTYATGTGGFRYIHFPAGRPPLLGGIGQADPGTPGFAPGHNFYLLVESLEPVLAAAFAAGGRALMPPTAIDGYRFAMFHDPEDNPIGLIEPFST
ncbi:MAG: antibiotic biosynthesis monooxygenase [Sphingomonas sp.]|nr:antibiotic biosynthesis monooxygenase [Sphingomonas sp.]